MRSSIETMLVALAMCVVVNSGANAQVSCQRNGYQTSCSNGQIFHQYGNITQDNYGHSWQNYEHETYGSDGTIYHHYGNQTYDNRGNYWQHNGGLTYGSNGTVCRRFGNSIHCN
jgi:hypothetical protein